MGRVESLDLVVLFRGSEVDRLRVEVDPDDAAALRELLLAAMEREGHGRDWADRYAMEVYLANERRPLFTFVITERQGWT
jgi:hypothetical protein